MYTGVYKHNHILYNYVILRTPYNNAMDTNGRTQKKQTVALDQ